MMLAAMCMAKHTKEAHKWAEKEIKGYDPDEMFQSFEDDAKEDTEEKKASRCADCANRGGGGRG